FEERLREVRALADQYQHLGVAQSDRELADALDGVGEDLGGEVFELGRGLELAHRVLVVVEDDDVQDRRLTVRRGLCTPAHGTTSRARCPIARLTPWMSDSVDLRAAFLAF